MAENTYTNIVAGTTVGTDAAQYINTSGKSTEIALKIVSEFAEASNESGYYITNSIVYAIAEDKFYKYNGSDWIETTLIALGSDLDATTGSLANHIADTNNHHSVTAAQIGSPELVNPSVVNNFVAFSDTTGAIKDSGNNATDFLSSSGGTLTGDLSGTSISLTEGIKIGNISDAASVSNVGTLRYRTSGNNSYLECSMQTAAGTYAWIVLVQNNW